ncbi:hypothetical protein F4778DRAFT_60351 [Xylariomycetidae sp. FL2044]|nr:hypothetical protein F4778DRAFT_60351 [Xylariomycetidae sp. FL2044]
MNRAAAVNFARVGAKKIWAGTVHIHADAKTGTHHHGPLESVIYVVKGPARMRWRREARVHRRGRAGPGDFILRPAVRPAPGEARVRADAERFRGGGYQSARRRAGGETDDGEMD